MTPHLSPPTPPCPPPLCLPPPPIPLQELLPFVDSMWTCEGIDFTQSPEYWLVQISALPFGTFGEMLGADNTPPTPVRTYTIISIREVSRCERLTGTQNEK